MVGNTNSSKDTYPIGSVYITSTNTNPSSMIGGTWTLIDKEYAEYNITSVAGSTSTFTIDSTNVDSLTRFLLIRTGKHIYIGMRVKTKVAIGDSQVDFGNFNLTSLGVGSIYAHFPVAQSDGGNAVCMIQFDTNGKLACIDVVSKTSGGTVASGSEINIEFYFEMRMSQMLDSVCDKFYWKRTA